MARAVLGCEADLMKRREFLKALGFGAVAPALVEPLLKVLAEDGIALPKEEIELVDVPRLPQSELEKHYAQTLKDMGIHNEAIERMWGTYTTLLEKRREIALKKKIHHERIVEAQHIGRAVRKHRREKARVIEAKRRIRRLRAQPNPALP